MMAAEKSRKFWNLQESLAEATWIEAVIKILVLKIIGKSQHKLCGGVALDDQSV